MKAEMDLGTDKKAFQINLDAKKYGTFAEIGAGQEVARRFFHVGGAAGTVAKTMSAYDMIVSDAIYGKSDRYVGMIRGPIASPEKATPESVVNTPAPDPPAPSSWLQRILPVW